jgi:hypothetical protein
MKLSNYRIKKVTKPNGKVWYFPQRKILGFLWRNISSGYSDFHWANDKIIEDYESYLGDFVEYLSPDTSETVPSTPNPPPTVL